MEREVSLIMSLLAQRTRSGFSNKPISASSNLRGFDLYQFPALLCIGAASPQVLYAVLGPQYKKHRKLLESYEDGEEP